MSATLPALTWRPFAAQVVGVAGVTWLGGHPVGRQLVGRDQPGADGSAKTLALGWR
jgi:hypothetical protein